MRIAACLVLVAAAVGLWLPKVSNSVEIRRVRRVAERVGELSAQSGIVITYEEDTDPPARLLAPPRAWRNEAISPDASRRALEGFRPDFRVVESPLGLHVISSRGQALLDTRISVPRQSRTFLASVEAVCREVARIRGVPLRAEWAGETLNISPDQLYGGAIDSPYIPWGARDRTAREALVDLFAGSKTSFSWRLTCDATLPASATECKLAVLLRQRWTEYAGRPLLEAVVRDHCVPRPGGGTDCAWPEAPPPPPAR